LREISRRAQLERCRTRASQRGSRLIVNHYASASEAPRPASAPERRPVAAAG